MSSRRRKRKKRTTPAGTISPSVAPMGTEPTRPTISSTPAGRILSPVAQSGTEPTSPVTSSTEVVTSIIERALNNGATQLNLSARGLTVIPEAMGQLSQLRFLNLNRNNLAALPESIGQLTQLQDLDLSKNKLTVLPDCIGRLTQLKFLMLEGNPLTELPKAIGNLTQLRYLDISNNQLAALPDAIKNIGSLRGLYLHGNDRLGLPNELLGPRRDEVLAEHTLARPSQILEYYFRVRRGRRPLNEAKLILVGRGAVGKSSIVNQLVHRRFHQGEKKTEGIHCTSQKHSRGDWARRREPIFRRRQVSDPAGQARIAEEPPARWTVCLRPNGSSDCPESSEE